MRARISFPKYGNPRTTFRGKDKIFTEMNSFPYHLPITLEAALTGVKVSVVNRFLNKLQ
jgi:hypothetical protein